MIDPNVPLAPSPYDKDYEITDAMFGAFRTPGGMPFFWKLMGWAIVFLTIVGAIFIPPMLSTYVDFIASAFEAEMDPDPNAAWAILYSMGSFLGMTLLYSLAYVAVMSAIRAAFFRGYFFGEVEETFPLNVGGDELRQSLSMLGFYFLLVLIIFGVALVAIFPMILMIGGLGPDNLFGFFLSMLLLYVGIFAAYIWFGVRFCTAGALTALRGRIHVLAARHVSRHRFWALFGSILVAGLIGYVVCYAAFAVGLLMAFSGLNFGELLTIMSGTDPESTLEAIEKATESASFRISTIFAIALVSAGYAFYSLMLAGPQAFFTKQWAEAHLAYEAH